MKPHASPRRQIEDAKIGLFDAIESMAHARANASWLNGYRAGGKDTEEIRDREAATWKRIEELRVKLDAAVSRYAQMVRRGVRRTK